ncbi:MAG: tetratricopeptide repeat protein [Nitrospira sp.]|nr:tetratricopeptide repeat protein [Nitrospira sp.]
MGIDRSKVLHSAQLFASKGQFDAAITEWKKLSAESPADGSIYNSIGELHLKRNAPGEAVSAFLQAANAFRAEGATLKAIATYKKVLKLDPSRYDIYRYLGDLNAERGLLSSAVQDYLTLGKYYLKERKSKEALEVYKKIVSQDPSNLDAQQRVAELCVQENMQDEATKVYLQLGRERSAQQRYSEAKEAYQSVLRIDPANSEAAQFIEHFEKSGGDPTRFARSSASIPATGKSLEPMDLLAEARRRIEEKQFAGAEAILNQLLSKEPGNPQVCQLLARLHLHQGQLQIALGEYRFLAGAALRAQEYPQAEALIQEFLAVEPNSVPLLELHGELYEEQGDLSTAVLHYGKAVEVLLEHPEPGIPTLHEEIFQKIKGLVPDSPVVHRLETLLHDAPPAAESLDSRADQAAPAPDVFTLAGAEPDNARGTTARSSGEPGFRFASTDEAVPVPDVPPAASARANAAGPAPSGSDQQAPEAAAATPLLTRDAQLRSYLEAGQVMEAELWLNRLVGKAPDDAELRELLGRLFERKGDGAAAALHYARAMELQLAASPECDTAPLTALYLKLNTLVPAHPLVVKLAPLFLTRNEQQDAAPVEAPEEVADVLDPEVHYTLGVAYKNMGLLDEAQEEFSVAMQSPAVFLDSCLMTAVCLKERGRADAASTQLERLLTDSRCQGAKGQAIRYELGLLYEQQAQWEQAVTMFESIPTFHDVPERLSSIRTEHPVSHSAAKAFGYAS